MLKIFEIHQALSELNSNLSITRCEILQFPHQVPEYIGKILRVFQLSVHRALSELNSNLSITRCEMLQFPHQVPEHIGKILRVFQLSVQKFARAKFR